MEWYTILSLILLIIVIISMPIYNLYFKYTTKRNEFKLENIGKDFRDVMNLEEVVPHPLNINNGNFTSNEVAFHFAPIHMWNVEMNRIYEGDSKSIRMNQGSSPFSTSLSKRSSTVNRDWVKADSGNVFITNKRILMCGSKKMYSLSYKTIKNIEVLTNKKIIIRYGSIVSPYMIEVKSKKELIKVLSYIKMAKNLDNGKK